jgi:hypothetical protein
MENKLDNVCRRLRDVGIFFIGIATVSFTAFYIWSQIHSPEREMQAAMEKNFTDALAHPDKK